MRWRRNWCAAAFPFARWGAGGKRSPTRLAVWPARRSWTPIFPIRSQAGRAAQGVDTIVYAVGVAFPEFDRHAPLMRTTLEAAVAAGVARLLLVTGIYSYGVPRTPRVAETHPREPESHKDSAANSRRTW